MIAGARAAAAPPPAGWGVLDAADPAAVAAYERGFYDAFAAVRPDGLIRRLWQWDDAAGRLAARVPYADQLVYVDRDGDGTVRHAMAVSHGHDLHQAAAFGFRLPLPRPGCIEVLTFFVDGRNDVLGVIAFWDRCCADLRARGLHTGYATTAPRPLPLYRRFGAQVLEEREVEGEVRYLLRLDFRAGWFIPRRGAARLGCTA